MVSFFLSLAFDPYFPRLRGHFGSPEGSKSVTLGRFLMTFRGPGTHVRIELSLQSQHDLEGSGGSENRRFLDVFFRWTSRRYPRVFFADFSRSREPNVAPLASQMLPESHTTRRMFLFRAELLHMRVPGCLLGSILGSFWCVLGGVWRYLEEQN